MKEKCNFAWLHDEISLFLLGSDSKIRPPAVPRARDPRPSPRGSSETRDPALAGTPRPETRDPRQGERTCLIPFHNFFSASFFLPAFGRCETFLPRSEEATEESALDAAAGALSFFTTGFFFLPPDRFETAGSLTSSTCAHGLGRCKRGATLKGVHHGLLLASGSFRNCGVAHLCFCLDIRRLRSRCLATVRRGCGPGVDRFDLPPRAAPRPSSVHG
jgi:hypothetical protein